MTTYTHFFTFGLEQDGVRGAVFPLEDFEKIREEHISVRACNRLKLLEPGYTATIVRPEGCKPWLRIDRGCSYLHIQHGYICAGAGGLNSSPVRKLKG